MQQARRSTWSLWLASLCSQLVFVVLRYGLHYRYQTICRNLSRAFPRKTTPEIVTLLEDYYRHLSDLCVEPFLFALASRGLRNRLAHFANPQLLHQLYRQRKPVVLLASHYGNWEYLIQLPVVSPYPVFTAYSPPRQRWVDKLLLRLRQRFGVHLIPKNAFYRQMVVRSNRAAEPALLAVIADQRPAPASLKQQLLFLEQPTFVQLGAERLAQQLDAVVVTVDCLKVDQFCYEYHLRRVKWQAREAEPLALTRYYYRHLEKQIRRSPAYWLWSHDRWKTAPPTRVPSPPLACGAGVVSPRPT